MGMKLSPYGKNTDAWCARTEVLKRMFGLEKEEVTGGWR
jgi:hypothetical protein